jgi:F-box-like
MCNENCVIEDKQVRQKISKSHKLFGRCAKTAPSSPSRSTNPLSGVVRSIAESEVERLVPSLVRRDHKSGTGSHTVLTCCHILSRFVTECLLGVYYFSSKYYDSSMDASSTAAKAHLRQAIDDKIKPLEDSIRVLKCRRNALAPISTLPPEILTEIFSILSHSAYDNEKVGYLAWLWVTHVCHNWREIALNHPRLWSHINFTKLTRLASVRYSLGQR